MPSRLSPQWLCGNSCTWAHDNRTSCAQVHELPQSHCGDNREGTLFHDNIYIYIYINMYYLKLGLIQNMSLIDLSSIQDYQKELSLDSFDTLHQP